ncbi:hypothetical protein BLNAU_7481 [Blattamonas nauphoetae]|uniref:Uncharacterized protein n=1 Tax=Blattamonas nauphoetae TaxID=2049346 RepID=A0ABQ9Y1G1_9EUKA|nr:hypothetical protein BLNAU_7481 [Blattamonas nauphoetae]
MFFNYLSQTLLVFPASVCDMQCKSLRIMGLKRLTVVPVRQKKVGTEFLTIGRCHEKQCARDYLGDWCCEFSVVSKLVSSAFRIRDGWYIVSRDSGGGPAYWRTLRQEGTVDSHFSQLYCLLELAALHG